LQEYLEALADEDELPSRRERRLLMSYAEFRFKMHGGGKCAVCRASVRHVLPVKVERLNGTMLEYPCLCTRCMEAEKPVSRRISMAIGQARIEWVARGQEPPRVLRAKAS
jgi:hypothetical protein